MEYKKIIVKYKTERNIPGYTSLEDVESTINEIDPIATISGYLIYENEQCIALAQGFYNKRAINLHFINKNQIISTDTFVSPLDKFKPSEDNENN